MPIMRARNVDLSRVAGGQGQPQAEVLVIGSGNNTEYSRIAGGSVADTANANTIGGMLVVHRVDIPDAAITIADLDLPHKERLIDAWLVKTGGAGGVGDIVRVFDEDDDPIIDTLSINVADNTIVRAVTIDDDQHVVGAVVGDTRLTVRCDKASGANVACTVYVLCLRVA